MFARIQVVRPAVASLLMVTGLTIQACDGSTEPTPDIPLQAQQPLAVNPSSASILVGESVQFSVIGAGVQGAVIEWTSSDPTVVMVSPEGLATGVGLGSATLSATRGGYAATAQVSVSGRRLGIDPQPKRRMRPY
jgi:uncharacterized protein YjdB